MSQSPSDAQLAMLRLEKRHLMLPTRGVGVADQRNDLALLVSLQFVEPHDADFRLTAKGTECLLRVDALKL